MRVEDPTGRGKVPSARFPAIRISLHGPRLSLHGPRLSRIGERPMIAIADQTHDELATTTGIASGMVLRGDSVIPGGIDCAEPLRGLNLHVGPHDMGAVGCAIDLG